MRKCVPYRHVLLLAAAGALAGCTVGPDFAPPQAPGGAAYRSLAERQSAPAGAPSVEEGTGPDERWWTVFGMPELDRLVNRAIAHNASLEASNATLAAAREEIAAARGKRLPQINANARAEHQQANLAAFGFKPSPELGLDGNPEFDLYSVGGGVSFALDPFGRRRRSVEQSAAEAEAQLRRTQAAHLAIAGRVVTQVLTIAAIRARIDTANALLDEDRRTIDLTQKRKDAGEGTLVEVLNARSQFENDRGDLPQLDQQLAVARHLLATLIGVMPADLPATHFNLDALLLPRSIPVIVRRQNIWRNSRRRLAECRPRLGD